MVKFIALITLTTLTTFTAYAGPDSHHPIVTVPKDFETLKGLVGTWEGKTKMGETEQTITVTYNLTSNGTAIIETLGKGTPHEMVSIYSARGKNVNMTHYCAIGNQPEMKLKKVDGKSFSFEMVGNKGIDNPKDMHMRAVTLTLADATHLKQEWTNFKDGKKGETAIFEFTKK